MKIKNVYLGEKLFDFVNKILLTIILLLILYPIWFVLAASVSDPIEVLNGNVVLFPKGFSLDGYSRVFKDQSILRGYINTIGYTFFGTVLNVVLTAMMAYSLSRRDFVGRGLITFLLTVTMFFGGGTIPTYLTYKAVGLVNTPIVLVVRGAVSVWNVIIMRTFFEGISYSLQEAAFIDGASNIKVFMKVIMPLSKPIVAVMCLYYGVFHWNDFMGGLLYIDDKEWYPLQLILRNIILESDISSLVDSSAESVVQQQMMAESLKYSVIVVASLPAMIIYPYLQKYFVQGTMAGSVKG